MITTGMLFGALLPMALATDLAIVHATVLPVAGPPIEDGTVLVRDGRIEAIGAGLPVPEGTTSVVDATGMWLTPGMIDVHSHMGVYAWPSAGAHLLCGRVVAHLERREGAQHLRTASLSVRGRRRADGGVSTAA